MNELDEWMHAVCAALGVAPEEVDRTLVLDLARDVAHQVLRPAAPLTAFVLGVAVGRGADPATAAATLTALARARTAPHPALSGGPQPAGDPPPVQHQQPGQQEQEGDQ